MYYLHHPQCKYIPVYFLLLTLVGVLTVTNLTYCQSSLPWSKLYLVVVVAALCLFSDLFLSAEAIESHAYFYVRVLFTIDYHNASANCYLFRYILVKWYLYIYALKSVPLPLRQPLYSVHICLLRYDLSHWLISSYLFVGISIASN